MKLAERQHLGRVAALGCIACRQMGYPDSPAEIHHIREGYGKGQRASHFETIGLCPPHHRGTAGLKVPSIHGSKNAFIKAFGTEHQLLELVQSLLTGEKAAGHTDAGHGASPARHNWGQRAELCDHCNSPFSQAGDEVSDAHDSLVGAALICALLAIAILIALLITVTR